MFYLRIYDWIYDWIPFKQQTTMSKNIEIKIIQSSKTDGTKKEMVIKGTIEKNDFNEHDTAACMFALEFAANNYTDFPMRVHINEA